MALKNILSQGTYTDQDKCTEMPYRNRINFRFGTSPLNSFAATEFVYLQTQNSVGKITLKSKPCPVPYYTYTHR
jgi:hypothetical protein